MQIQENVMLAPYTSLHCGGPAEKLALCASTQEIIEALEAVPDKQPWILGYGTNSLISDKGLPGLVIMPRGGAYEITDIILTADASAWWDDVVAASIEQNLWGIELMSGIPSSVGAAITGNIAAYGQQVSDTLVGIEVLDSRTREISYVPVEGLGLEYRASALQQEPYLIVTKTKFRLSRQQTTPLAYASAQTIADELGLDKSTLSGRRSIILETRRRAGSLFDPDDPNSAYTAGSFFKNPLVTPEQAKHVASFDETGKSLERILKQNELHGGKQNRVSAAHVLLAAGFQRRQTWGNVRLHPEHVLKLENTGGATAQEIYNVAQSIISTVHEKLGITLKPEVQFLGQFRDDQTINDTISST